MPVAEYRNPDVWRFFRTPQGNGRQQDADDFGAVWALLGESFELISSCSQLTTVLSGTAVNFIRGVGGFGFINTTTKLGYDARNATP